MNRPFPNYPESKIDILAKIRAFSNSEFVVELEDAGFEPSDQYGRQIWESKLADAITTDRLAWAEDFGCRRRNRTN